MTSSYEKALEEYHKERKTEKFYKTKGYKKILRYVLAIIQGDTFQKMIDNMRIEFKIPEKGYITPK
ncbi:MAG: hypothetical protein WCO09_04100, partial [bacterium]